MDAPEYTDRPETILVVEDSPTQLEKLKYILEGRGFRTLSATNGAEGVNIVAKARPDVIISDVVMPEMDGFEMCRRVKADAETRNIPVMLLTALSDPGDVLRGLECGADNFITKPYDEKYLLTRLDGIIANMNLREAGRVQLGIRIAFRGETYFITSERQQILDLLISTYEAAVQRNGELVETQEELRLLNEQLDQRVRERTAELEREVEVRRLAEAKVIRLNRLYSVLSLSNQTIIRLTEPGDLLAKICRIAVEHGQFALAWVGMRDGGDGPIRAVARMGGGDGYLERFLEEVNGSAGDAGPLVDALREGGRFICNDISLGLCPMPVRDAALGLGYRSFATFPLYVEDAYAGSFNVCAGEAGFFDERETSLLAEMSNDISFALTAIRHEGQRARAEEEMRKLSVAVEQSSDWILMTDRAGVITYANKSVERISGYGRDELAGQRPAMLLQGGQEDKAYREMLDLVSAGEAFSGMLTKRKKTGEPFELYLTVSPLRDEAGDIVNLVHTAKDITEQKALEQRLDFLAYYDALTGLPNRRLLMDRLGQDITRAEAAGGRVAVLLVDIDRFRLINDTFGAGAGDAVLVEVGRRLAEKVGDAGTAARLGNDEFMVSLACGCDSDEVALFAEGVMEEVSRPVMVGETEVTVTASMGIALYPDDGGDAEAMLKSTALALSKARETGRRAYSFYTPAIDTSAHEFMVMERSLFDALRKGEYVLHYQPYFDAGTRALVGMEALIRWDRPGSGLVPPGKFIPVLEDTKMIVEVGDWIVRTAAGQVRDWLDKGLPAVPVSVNLSLVQFRQKDLFRAVDAAVGEIGIEPGMMTLEITESAFMRDIEFTTSVLKDFKARGFSISIDDFGTGYSSLAYLKRFPVDNLKIDISFVREITKDPDAASIITAIIAMAHSLGIKTIAEGVETEEQWNILRLLRCDVAQGYFFSKPVPAAEVEERFLMPKGGRQAQSGQGG